MSAAPESKTPCPAATEQRASVNLSGNTQPNTDSRRELQDELWRIITAAYQIEALAQAITDALDQWQPADYNATPFQFRAHGVATHLTDVVQAQALRIVERLNAVEMAVRHV